MKFGPIELNQAEGAILAHSMRVAGKVLRKGRSITRADINLMRGQNISVITAAQLEAGDLHEDQAALRIAQSIAGAGLLVGAAFTGRCNLYAEAAGLVTYDPLRIDAINLLDEAITIATLPPDQPVSRRQIVATVKIIPYGVAEHLVTQAEQLVNTSPALLQVARFESKRLGLVQTQLPGAKQKVLDRTSAVLGARLNKCGSRLQAERRCPHQTDAVADSLLSLSSKDCDILLISGASATTDRRDVIPSGIERAGGTVTQLGMPVDPGNLLILGRMADGRPVLGLPGCARSPATNGMDLVLHRLLADLTVTTEDIRRMGAGGLLKGVPGYRSFRTDLEPKPRSAVSESAIYPSAPRIAAIVLAAGQSQRMEPGNKLLLPVDGQTLVRRVTQNVLASQAEPVVVVLGHDASRLREELADLEVLFAENPDFASGLSSSLQSGLAALPLEIDGALICLADMPWVATGDLDRLIAAFSEEDNRLVCVPTWQGQRGNPVLWAKRYFQDFAKLQGDRGARDLVDLLPDQLCEVAMPHDGVVKDIDNTAQVLSYT